MTISFDANSLLSFLVAATPVLIPVGLFLYRVLLGQLPAAKAAKVEGEVKLLVSAAEQMYKAVPGSGAYKKAEVLRQAQHLGVDPVRLNLLIEAAVASLPHAA